MQSILVLCVCGLCSQGLYPRGVRGQETVPKFLPHLSLLPSIPRSLLLSSAMLFLTGISSAEKTLVPPLVWLHSLCSSPLSLTSFLTKSELDAPTVLALVLLLVSLLTYR